MQKKAISIVCMVLMTSFINIFLIQTSVASSPVISNAYPILSQWVPYNPRLIITVNDAENDPLTVIFQTNASGTWQKLGTYNDGNKIYTQNTSNMDIKNKKYYWSINVTDGTVWVNRTYSLRVTSFVLRWSVDINLNTTKPPLAADVDHDGIYEVFAIGNNTICCFNGSTGTIRWRYNNTDFLGYDSQMEIGDLNNDGMEELVASAQSKTIALHANNGTPYWGNEKGEVKVNSSNKNIVIADINGNGYPYVYIASDDTEHGENGAGRIRKLSGINGEVLVEVFAFRPCYGSLSLADSDNDGKFELYSTDRSYSLTDGGAGRGMICYDADTLNILWYHDMITCSSHSQVLIDVNNDGILDSVALAEISNGIYVVDGKTWDKMIGKWGDTLDDLTTHSQPTVYDIDNDGNLELITCSNAEPKIWDLGSWSLEDSALNVSSEPPKVGNVIGDEKLEIIDAQNRINIFDQNYQYVETIKTPASAHTLVQDLDNNGRNELILISQGAVIVYDTSGVAPAKLPRTNSEFYSERRTGAGVYTPPPGAPQPIIKDIYPQNNSQDIQLNPTLCVHLIDFHDDLMNLTISTNTSGSWSTLTTLHDVGNGWYNITTTQMNQLHTTYYWRVSAIDSYADKLTTTNTYKFTTQTPPVITDIIAYPSTILPGESINISCHVADNSFVNLVKTNITYPDGHTTNTTNLGGEPHWNVLTYDDFESGFGNFTDGGTDCSTYSGNTYAYQGNKAAEIRDYQDINSSFFLTQSVDVDTPRYTSLTVDFWFKTHSLEPRENLWVKYFDGTHWQLVADYLEERDFQNDVFYHKIIWINETDYVFPKDMKIRLQCDASDDTDNIYIDKIYINTTTAEGPQYYYNNTYTQSGVYHYFIWANDGNGNRNSSILKFFKIGGNLPPYISGNPSPLNSSTNNPVSFTSSIPINDYEGDAFSWTIQCSNGQDNSGTNDANGTKSLSLSGLAYSTTFKIWVNATDPVGSGLYTRRWFTFTTQGNGVNNPPVFGVPSPANGSTGNLLSQTWSIPINDLEGNTFSWTIQCNNRQTSNATGANGTKSLSLSGLAYSMTYKIWVNATDPTGSGLYTRKWFTFTTKSSDGGSGGGEQPPSEPENKKPIANASAGEPYKGFINSAITFDGSKSYDPDGNITKWFWVFGDITNGTGKIIQHTYSKAGTYNVTLTVTDNEGTTNTNTTICVITQQNRPPTTPLITGPTDGTKNTTYTYTAVSTDADNDTIKYTVDWEDPISLPQSSGFLPNGTSFTINHSWASAGRYDVTVIVTDNKTQTASKIIVYIDAVQTGDIGYLFDNNSDGIYEAFYSDALKQITAVQTKNGNYNIDNDGDGTFDYTFDVILGLRTYQEPKTPGFELVFFLCAIVVSILLWKKKRNA